MLIPPPVIVVCSQRLLPIKIISDHGVLNGSFFDTMSERHSSKFLEIGRYGRALYYILPGRAR